MNHRSVSVATLVLLSTLTATAIAQEVRRSYIVQLADPPVASYTGEVSGLRATKPAVGQRLNVNAADVQNYIGYLRTRQAGVTGTLRAARITHDYKVVFNGFAALLTDAEVRALKKNGDVANITADSVMKLDTSYTPSFIGLDAPAGLWPQLGGQAMAGEGIVIGIVDSGIWPENPSFADRVDSAGVPTHNSSGTLVYGAPPAGWKGACTTGEGFALANCNNKLIGARYFKSPTQTLHWTEFVSARDSVAGPEGRGGHGTHTASTAGGNANVEVLNNGTSLGKVSGIAPRARIAAYKVCWTDGITGGNGCATSNSVAAIEQAVKDGVNVINFSIGPNAGGGTFNEATEVAFLGAANAGVFVATSAGNSGPAATTPAPTAHLSPWLTSVGNSTHNRLFVGDAVLGNGATLIGASSNANTAPARLILARDAGFAGAPVTTSLLQCFGTTDGVAALLDPAKVGGKILVCDRGSNVLVNKSANAKAAGAVGMIIANVSTANDSTFNQAHSLSTVHMTVANGTALKAYMDANTTSAAAALGNLRGVINASVEAPVMASSSSRGPNVANANIMKPDLAAPGTDVLAGVTADLSRGERDAVAAGGAAPANWAFYSGTSMASPHVAGLAALLKQKYPTWSPAAIKSALMTSATTTRPDGLNGSVAWDSTARTTGTLPWGQGSGQVTPNSAANPGLVYDANQIDYARFLCGVNANVYSAATCQAVGTIPAYNLNLASLTAANVLGSQTLTRTVTNVGAAATFNASASLPGYKIEVQPASLVLGAGQKASFKVKLTRTTAPLDTWAYGDLTWSNGVTSVRSPLTARGTALAAPASVYSEATTGSKIYTIGTGFSGPIGSVKSGLLPAAQETRTIGQAGQDSAVHLAACRAGGGAGVNVHTVSVAAGTLLARFALFDDDTAGGSNSDLDLIVLKPDGSLASSGNGGSNERIELSNPAAGTYNVCVIGYEPAEGSAAYKLSSWVLQPNVINGAFKALMPGVVYVGGTATVGISWSGLAAGQRHLGAVRYLASGVPIGTTLIDVNTNDPLPLFETARRTPARAN